MSIQYGFKRAMFRPMHTMYIGFLTMFIYHIGNLGYVTKMRYNKDKDLVFVERPNRLYWGYSEKVFEMHHLEQMVPSPVTSIKDMTALDERGILTVYDMAQRESIKLYKEEKYWNMDLRDEFMHETTGLWGRGTHGDKHQGKFLSTANAECNPEDRDMIKRVEEAMVNAVNKHGRVSIPTSHVESFYEKIEQEKQNIVSRA